MLRSLSGILRSGTGALRDRVEGVPQPAGVNTASLRLRSHDDHVQGGHPLPAELNNVVCEIFLDQVMRRWSGRAIGLSRPGIW